MTWELRAVLLQRHHVAQHPERVIVDRQNRDVEPVSSPLHVQDGSRLAVAAANLPRHEPHAGCVVVRRRAPTRLAHGGPRWWWGDDLIGCAVSISSGALVVAERKQRDLSRLRRRWRRSSNGTPRPTNSRSRGVVQGQGCRPEVHVEQVKKVARRSGGAGHRDGAVLVKPNQRLDAP